MNISEPNVTLQIIPASQLAGVQDQKVLIVGQMLTGSATAGSLVTDIGNDVVINDLFGAKSHIAGIVREFKKLNKVTRVDALPLADDSAAVKATSTIDLAYGTTATANATITVVVGSAKNHKYTIDVLSGDSETTIGAAIADAINADTDAPFSAVFATDATALTSIVTITAENGGTLANKWDIQVIGTIPGVAFTLAGWSGGSDDPSLTGVLDVIANIRYQTVAWPSSFDITVIEDELNARFNASNDVKDGVAIQTLVDTLSNLKSAVSALNSQSIVIIGNKSVSTATHIGGATVEMPDVITSQVCAVRALRLTDGELLTRFLTTVARSDQFGGLAIASLPYFNTALPNLPVADPVDFFSAIDLDELRDNAVSVVGPNRAFNSTIMGEFITTYLTDSAGNPDTSYKFLNTVDTASVIREFFFENFKRRYAQTRLTDGDLIAGRDMANAASIRAFCNELYDALANDALVQAGSAAKKDFNDNLVITTDVSTGTATIDMAPLLVTQLRAIIGTVQINFGS